MKYWFFDGNDVVGPFTPQELAERADFSVNSCLVCPEDFSEDEDSWKLAFSFADFEPAALSCGPAVSAPVKPAPPVAEESSPEEAALFDKEMDTFLKNPSILAGTAAPAPEGPTLKVPKKPAKPGPIEDYFNNINGEDLGDILGIPDPNENSDMNLPHVMEEHDAAADKLIDSVEADAPDEDEKTLPPIKTQRNVLPAVSVAASAQLLRQNAPADSPALKIHLVKQEEPLVSVPISRAKEDLPLVLPGEKLPAAKPTVADKKEGSVSQPKENKTAASAAQTEKKESKPRSVSNPVEVKKTAFVAAPALVKDKPLFVSAPTSFKERKDNLSPSVTAGMEPSNSFYSEASAASKTQQENVSCALKPAAVADLSARVLQTTPGKKPVPGAENGPAAVPQKAAPAPQPAPAKTEWDKKSGRPYKTEELKAPQKTEPLSPRLNQVKPKLKQTPEIEQFLTTQRQQIRLANQRKANFMLWILAFLLAAGVVVASFYFLGQAEEQANSVPRTGAEYAPAAGGFVTSRVESLASEPMDLEPESRVLPEPPVIAPPVPMTAPDRAMAAVQNYQLSGGRGTIASYFDRFYKNQLAQGYNGEWSAEALHKNTYIVKYRLSKTRVEPVVYVFQADAASGRLTGALNNVALDLLGKI